jgi:hypothetical protein
MAIGNLNLYDVLVDLIPGAFLIIILSPLFRLGNLSVSQGIGVLLAGYVIGRLLHAIGSFSWVNDLRISLEECLFPNYAEERKYGLSFRNRLKSHYDDNNGFSHPGDNLDVDVIDSAIEKLGSKMNDSNLRWELSDKDIKSHESLKDSKSHKVTDRVLALRYFGENYLFDKNTLYLQYEITATFYRSLWVASSFSAFIYSLVFLLNIVGQVTFQSIIFPPLSAAEADIGDVLYPLVFATISFLISYISLRQRLKFRFKKTRAFINDLHINLSEDQ